MKSSLKDGSLFLRLTHALRSNDHLIGCASTTKSSDYKQGVESNQTKQGIVKNHAYAVLDCVKYLKDELILLRNPQGTVEWNGKFSAGDKIWAQDLKKKPKLAALKAKAADQGTFWSNSQYKH